MIAYRKEDNVTGELHAAALSLKEILEPQETGLSIFLFGFASPLGNVDAFTDADVERVKGSHGLAIYYFQENVDVDFFHELAPIQKYFVQGVEDQLARRVLYVGGMVENEFVWHPVPRNLADRWVTETTNEERAAKAQSLAEKIATAARHKVEATSNISDRTPDEAINKET